MNDLILDNIGKRYGEKWVLRHLSAHFPAGKRTCIGGSSGIGKTTLLRLIMGLETPDEGTISGVPERVSAVFQENRLFEDFSTLSNVTAVGATREQAAEHLRLLGLGDSLRAPVRTLSGGMKRRVAIVRAVLARGELLLLDEPFTGLDRDTKETVMAYLKQFTKGRTLLLITHSEEERLALAENIFPMPSAVNEEQPHHANDDPQQLGRR